MQSNMSLFTQLTKIDVLLRLITGPLIFISPIIATICVFILDGFDGEILKRSGYARHEYSTYDKVLDYWWYIWILLYVFSSNAPYKYLFLTLFLYRTVGQIFYLFSHKGILFFLFPNVFESLFYYYLVAHLINKEDLFFSQPMLTYAMVVLTALKLLQEYIVHIKLMNFSGVYLRKTSYWPQKTMNPYKVFILFSLALALGVTINNLMLQKPTDSYITKARQQNSKGTILTYSPSGTLSAMIYRHTKTKIQFTLFFASASEQRPRCNASINTLNATTQEDGVSKQTSFFTYTDSCLTSLPDGTYKVLIQEPNQQDVVIEFEVIENQMKK